MQKGYKRNNKGMAVLHFFIGLLFIALLVCAGYFVLTKLDYSDKLANPDASMRPYVEMTAQPDQPSTEPDDDPELGAVIAEATEEPEDFVDVSVTATPTPTPKPTKIPTDKCASARKKGFNVPVASDTATVELTNFYVSEPNNNRVIQFNGYAFQDNAAYDCKDSQAYLVVTQQETGDQIAYKATMKEGISGADLSFAACQNASESEFRLFINVKSYDDGDYSLGIVLYYELDGNTAYSYHELPQSFTIVDGAVAAEDNAVFGETEFDTAG